MLLLTSIPPITGPILSPLMAPITVLLPQWMLIILFAIIPFYMWLSYWPGRKAKVVPIRASAFSPDKVPSNLDTIVIGSGSGGSSCILAQSGQKEVFLNSMKRGLADAPTPLASMAASGTQGYTTPPKVWVFRLIVPVLC